jgi:hypothetical protein
MNAWGMGHVGWGMERRDGKDLGTGRLGECNSGMKLTEPAVPDSPVPEPVEGVEGVKGTRTTRTSGRCDDEKMSR